MTCWPSPTPGNVRSAAQEREGPGGGALNVTQDADAWIAGKADEWGRKAPSAGARRNFQRMAEQYREQMFGAGQIKKYRDAEADAAIQNGLDDVAMNYDDDAAVETAREAIYTNPDLANEEKERAWQKLEAREADVARAERQDELDWKNGWIDRIIENSKSYEDAMGMVAESGASGATRLQLEKLVKQVWQQEKFKESITDWAQAFQEIKGGKFKSVDEVIYRWGGRLKTGTLQGLIRMFYTGNTAIDRAGGGRGGKIEYVGYSFSKAIENAMGTMGIEQGTRDAALFCTLVGEELAAFEEKNKRKASALEKQEILDQYVKAALTSEKVEGMPGYMNRVAEERGFERTPVYNSYGWLTGYKYIKANGDGTFTEFDPSAAYDLSKVGGAEEKDEAPLPPLPPLESGGMYLFSRIPQAKVFEYNFIRGG